MESTAGARYSRQSIINTLAGHSGGQYKLPERLAKHPAFGRLAFLNRQGVEEAIEGLIEKEVLIKRSGEVEINRPGEVKGIRYQYLEIAEHD